MTKKYWGDWQKRIGETKNIYKFWFYNNGFKRKLFNGELNTLAGDKVSKAYFHGDAADLVIERHSWGNGHYVVENEYLTLHRNEIASIEFIKY